MAVEIGGVAVDQAAEFPLVGSPGDFTLDANVGVAADDLPGADAAVLLLIGGQIIFPTLDRRLVESADDGDIRGVILAEAVDVAELPGGEHFRDRPIDLLWLGEGKKLGGGGWRRRFPLLRFLPGPEARRQQP